jgi:Arc/MetJ-type ribon-helix-helix transcriptional regulator
MAKTTYRLPATLRQQMREAVVRDGYGLRGKSRWIREAIELLFKKDRALINVGLGDDLEENSATDLVVLTPIIENKIEETILKLRTQDPLMEGVQSSIIRAAIRLRLREKSVQRLDKCAF